MKTIKMTSAVAMLAATVMVGSSVAALADDILVPATHTHGTASRVNPKYQRARPLTVSKPVAPATAAITAPIGLAGTLVTAPLSGLSQAFGFGAIGGPAKPLPIVARYAGVGPTTDSVNQGWAQPVPLSANGPIYKLEPVANNGGVSPFSLIAAPITAATTLAAAPVNAAASVLGAPPAPPPVF